MHVIAIAMTETLHILHIILKLDRVRAIIVMEIAQSKEDIQIIIHTQ